MDQLLLSKESGIQTGQEPHKKIIARQTIILITVQDKEHQPDYFKGLVPLQHMKRRQCSDVHTILCLPTGIFLCQWSRGQRGVL
jgi:hypothetical protein